MVSTQCLYCPSHLAVKKASTLCVTREEGLSPREVGVWWEWVLDMPKILNLFFELVPEQAVPLALIQIIQV